MKLSFDPVKPGEPINLAWPRSGVKDFIRSGYTSHVHTLRKVAATTLAESASAAIGGFGPNSVAQITAHTNGESVWGMSKDLGTNAHSYSMTHQTREHYGTSGTSKTTFGPEGLASAGGGGQCNAQVRKSELTSARPECTK